MPARKLKEILDKAIELYFAGNSLVKAGELAGCSEATLTREVRKRRLTKLPTQKEVDRMIELYNKGFTIAEIAKDTGWHKNCCVRRLKKARVFQKRTPSECRLLKSEYPCVKCKVVKDRASFSIYKNGKPKGTCITCKRGYKVPTARATYNTSKLKNKRRAQLEAEFKNRPCSDCGKQYEGYLMELDHIKGKTMALSAMLARHSNIERMREEASKCELVCILCHRQRTQSRIFMKMKPLDDTKNGKQRAQRRALRKMVDEIKTSNPCTDCGFQYAYSWQMEFDHRPGTIKTGSVSALVSTMNRQKVLDEIAKCDLVCAICHRRRTYARRQYIRKDYLRTANQSSLGNG